MNEFQRRAFADVGLDPIDAERLRGEHDCLTPSGVEPDLLDVDERQRLMRRIAGAYASMYLRAPDAFLWMGFAAIALHDGVRPTSELAAAAARLRWLPAIDRGPVGRAVRWLLGAGPAAAANDAMRAAFEANFAIFSDLYWVHVAYLEGGMPALRRLHRDGQLATALLSGFMLIHRRRVVDGNRLLFRHEQERSVTPVFEKYHRAMAFATRLGLISVPNRRLRGSCEELERPAEWTDEESYGPFAARWRWLESSSWEPFVRLHARDRRALHREVWRAVTGVPEAA